MAVWMTSILMIGYLVLYHRGRPQTRVAVLQFVHAILASFGMFLSVVMRFYIPSANREWLIASAAFLCAFQMTGDAVLLPGVLSFTASKPMRRLLVVAFLVVDSLPRVVALFFVEVFRTPGGFCTGSPSKIGSHIVVAIDTGIQLALTLLFVFALVQQAKWRGEHSMMGHHLQHLDKVHAICFILLGLARLITSAVYLIAPLGEFSGLMIIWNGITDLVLLNLAILFSRDGDKRLLPTHLQTGYCRVEDQTSGASQRLDHSLVTCRWPPAACPTAWLVAIDILPEPVSLQSMSSGQQRRGLPWMLPSCIANIHSAPSRQQQCTGLHFRVHQRMGSSSAEWF